MSQSIQSGKTTVSGNVTTTIGSISPAGTSVLVCGGAAISTSTTTTLATVTVGKTAYIMGWSITCNADLATANVNSITATLKADATVLDVCRAQSRGGAGSVGTGTCVTKTFSVPAGAGIPLAATKTINVVSSVSSNAEAYVTVYYIEV